MYAEAALIACALLGLFLLWHFSDLVPSCFSALNAADALFVKLVSIFSTDLVH